MSRKGRPPELFLRADGGPQTGSGHVMRCLSLAQAWLDEGGAATLVTAPGASALEERVRSEGIEIRAAAGAPGSAEDISSFAALSNGAAAVVLDGYLYGAPYQRGMREAGRRTLVIDDNRESTHYFADFVLNHNLHADAGLYSSREPHTHLLLGPRYSLLRREFRERSGWTRRVEPRARRILVTMGGSDPENCTLRVLEALARSSIAGLEVVAVVGGANPHEQSLRNEVAAWGGRVRIEKNVGDMAAWMAWADVAVASAGTTWAELAFMGLASVQGIVAGNQEANAARLASTGLCRMVGWFNRLLLEELAREIDGLCSDAGQREAAASIGRTLVPGDGAVQVARLLWPQGGT